jgi:hypothetical protein
LAHNPGVENVICENISLILNLIDNSEDEEIILHLLNLVAEVKTPVLLSSFEQYIPYFVQLLGGHKMRIACAVAECIRVISKQRPDLLESHYEEILKILSGASGELLRMCLDIQKGLEIVAG